MKHEIKKIYKINFILPSDGMDLRSTIRELESSIVDQALTRKKGNKNQASILLGLNRTTLVEKLRSRGLIVPKGKGK